MRYERALLFIAGVVLGVFATNARRVPSAAEDQRVVGDLDRQYDFVRTNAQDALLQLEHRWLDEENNPDVLQTILADDFVHVLPVGFVSKGEQLAYQRAHPAPHSGTKRLDDLRVRVFGSTGIVNGIVVATEAGGKVHKTIFTDVFVDRNGKWQAVNAQELPLVDLPRQ